MANLLLKLGSRQKKKTKTSFGEKQSDLTQGSFSAMHIESGIQVVNINFNSYDQLSETMS